MHGRTVLRACVALIAALAVTFSATGRAAGFWSTKNAQGSGTATTLRLSPPTGVAVPSTSSGSVPVSWTASGGDLTPQGYYVTRNNGSQIQAACGTSATNLTMATSCIDVTVPAGSYTYRVVAVFNSWTATSAPSSTVTVAAGNKLGFSQNPQSGSRAGESIGVVIVQLRDGHGNPVNTSGVVVTVKLTDPGGATLSGTKTASTQSNGAATFNGLSIDKAGTFTLTANAPGYAQAVSNSFVVVAGQPRVMSIVSGNGQSTPVGTRFPNPLVIRVTDEFGNPVSGVGVMFSAPCCGATATFGSDQAFNAVTDAAGLASAAPTANNTAGSYLIQVNGPGTNSLSFTLTNR